MVRSLLWQKDWYIAEVAASNQSANKRIIDKIAVIDSFIDGTRNVLLENAKLQRLYSGREIFVVHTPRSELDIEERRWVGVRAGT